jgi:ABC-type sugar transport system ATPase subunit
VDNKNALLSAVNVHKSFGRNKVLEAVDFEILPGEIHSLIGGNGAGKSTLLKMLFGIHQPDEGTIILNGEETVLHSPIDARGKGIAMIHQEPLAFTDMTVFENIVLGNIRHTRLGFFDRQDLLKKAAKVLDRLGLCLSLDQEMRGVSVAEQQLVEIGAALMSDANIIFMDEPTASLTPDEVERLFSIIHKLKEKGKSVVYVSHRLEEIKCLSDRITVLKDGKKVGTYEGSSMEKSDMIRLMIGCSVQDFVKKEHSAGDGELLFEADGISIPGIFTDISFQVRRGEVFGFFGLMGSGRTEVARALFGITPVESGEIKMKGKSIKIDSPSDAIKNRIALVPEDRQNLGVLVRQGISFNASFTVPDSFTGLFGWIDKRKEKQVAVKYVELLKTKYGHLDQPVGDLSGGNQQKVSLAKWLATDPDLLILDEPTRGIDVGAKAEVYKLINQLAESGKGVIMISSEVEEVLGLSDRILVMYEGRQTAILGKDEISEVRVLSAAHDHLEEGVC